jgi:phenylacetate-CoA ligase
MNLDDLGGLEDYLDLDVRTLDRHLDDPAFPAWQEQGQTYALRTFREAARRVPAYRDFLARHRVDPAKVRTFADFGAVPPTDKAGYIEQYPLEDLVWDGKPAGGLVFNASSGTTGTACYWPNGVREVAQAAALYELIYRRSFAIESADTLLMVCFGMGTWIAGSYTILASQFLGQKGYPFTLITPGFNKAEALKILADLAPKFRQTIVAGIPGFVKDLLEQWRAANPAASLTLRLLLAGEGFTEAWRDYVLGLLGSDARPTDVISLLGSADAGLMGFETPLSIACRRAAGDRGLRRALFGQDRFPALMSYIPSLRFFEDPDGELILTANRALPLIRYNTGDRGSILDLEQLGRLLGEAGPGSEGWPRGLPLVSVFGRGRFGATLYGANIHAEDVQEILLHEVAAGRVTGRFTLETTYTGSQDQSLRINVELVEGAGEDPGLAALLAWAFVERVRKASTEYERIWQEYGPRARPVVVLHPYGHPELFPADVQRKTS